MDASALAVGRARGAALVGRPLEITIPVTLEGSEGADPCAAADVFYGDNKVVRPPTVRWEPAGDGQGVVRLVSAVPIDEPVVTIELRVGCRQTISRRFVLLSELPPVTEPATPSLAQSPVRPAPARPPAADASSAPAPAATAPAPRPAAEARTLARAAATPQRATAGTAVATPARRERPAAAASRGDRLRLDLLDLTSERNPTLRLSPELQLPASSDPQARASAAALWAALQRTPEQILQDGERLQTLERDLQALRTQVAQHAKAAGDMRAQAEAARDEREQSSLLVTILLALVALLAAALGWLWWRARQLENVHRWFDSPRDPVPDYEPPTAPAPVPQPQAAEPAPAPAPVAIGAAAAAAIAQATSSGWGTLPTPEFHTSQGGTVRMVGVQELIDVHDKADFFIALGQHDQAIAVLESHVHDQVETSALAWMDLLEMYHRLGKRVEYEALSVEFRQRFAVQVPDFDHFDQPTSSLENYGRALSRIVALWPSRRVLDVIEESIFRKPGLPGAEPFSLEAYRELVLLYHIAKEVAPEEDSASTPLEYRATDFASTSLQPLNMLDTPPQRPQPVPPLAVTAPAPLPPLDPPSPQPSPDATVVMARPDFELEFDLGDDFALAPVPAPAPAPGLEAVPLAAYAPVPDLDPTLDPADPAQPQAPGELPRSPDRDRLMIPPSSPRIGLDIDLDAPPEELPPVRALPPLDFDTSLGGDLWNTQTPSDVPPRK